MSKPKYKKKATITKNNEVVNNKEVVNNLTIPNVYSESEIVEEIDMSKISGITFDPTNLTATPESDDSIDALVEQLDESKACTRELAYKIMEKKASADYSGCTLTQDEIDKFIAIYNNRDAVINGSDRYYKNRDSGYAEIYAIFDNRYNIDSVEAAMVYISTKRINKDTVESCVEIDEDLSSLADGCHFTFNRFPFGINGTSRICIQIPKESFDAFMLKYNIYDSVFMHSRIVPDAQMIRKIISGFTIPGGSICHHIDIVKLYNNMNNPKSLASKCKLTIPYTYKDSNSGLSMSSTVTRLRKNDISSMELSGMMGVILGMNM